MTHGNIKAQIDETAFVADNATLIGDVRMGKNSSVWFSSVIRADYNYCEIGENTNVQELCQIHCDADTPVILGKNVTVGHCAIVHSAQVDDNSLVGMGAILLNGTKVGKNCLIGAGALLTHNTVIPDGSLVLGVPAKVKRPLTEEEIASIQENADHYAELGAEFAAGNFSQFKPEKLSGKMKKKLDKKKKKAEKKAEKLQKKALKKAEKEMKKAGAMKNAEVMPEAEAKKPEAEKPENEN